MLSTILVRRASNTLACFSGSAPKGRLAPEVEEAVVAESVGSAGGGCGVVAAGAGMFGITLVLRVGLSTRFVPFAGIGGVIVGDRGVLGGVGGCEGGEPPLTARKETGILEENVSRIFPVNKKIKIQF